MSLVASNKVVFLSGDRVEEGLLLALVQFQL